MSAANNPTFRERLTQAASSTGSRLMIGLDPVIDKMPRSISRDPAGVLDFNRRIIEATHDLVIGYKLNFAFYEVLGPAGWDVLAQTRASIPPTLVSLADAKRGDIGDTSEMYAASILDTLGFDAVTVSPYVGREGIEPFLARKSRGTFVLCRTSNLDTTVQTRETAGGAIFEMIAREVPMWGENIGLVVGATDLQALARVRSLAPDTPFLVPGVGTQGGKLENAIAAATGPTGSHSLIAVSRSVLYASMEDDWVQASRRRALKLREGTQAAMVRSVTES